MLFAVSEIFRMPIRSTWMNKYEYLKTSLVLVTPLPIHHDVADAGVNPQNTI